MRVGIDPGVTGTICVINEPHNAYMHHWLMPVVQVGAKKRVDAAELGRILSEFVGMGATINLEQVHSMPRDGASAAFSFGHSCGVIEGILGALQLPYNLVTPQAWKKQAGLIGLDKDAARSRCIQLYPSLSELAQKGKGQALADALLIARYAR